MRKGRGFLLGTAACICAAAVGAGALLASFGVTQHSAAVQLGSSEGARSGESRYTQEVQTSVSEETTAENRTMEENTEAETGSESSGAVAVSLPAAAGTSSDTGEMALSVYFKDKAIVNTSMALSGLNVRSGKDESTDDNIVTQVDGDDILTVVSEEKDWTQVRTGDAEGFVRSDYLLYGDDAAESVKESAEAYAQVTVPSMNIRMGAGTSSDILDTAAYGEAYPVLSIEDGWVKVDLGNGLTGYMAGNCVTLNYVWNGVIIESNVAGAADDEVADSSTSASMKVSKPETEGQYLAMMAGQQGTDAVTSSAQLPSADSSADTTAESVSPESTVTENAAATFSAETAQDTAAKTPASETDSAAQTEAQTSAAALTAAGIEAFYNGPAKTEGDVVYHDEISVMVRWSDGSFSTVTDGWQSSDIGMILHAGTRRITVEYAGLTSSVEIPVAAAQGSDAVPAETTAVPAETTAVLTETNAVPAETTAVPTETNAVPAETTAVPAPTTGVPTETTATPAETTAVPTEVPTAPAGTASVTNVPLSGELTYYTLQLCSQYGIDYSVVFSVIQQESHFNPNAVSASGSGASGLMQIIPRFSAGRMAKLGVTNLFDPASNILVGVDMLAEYYYATGSWTAALTLYRYGTASGSSDYAQLILSQASLFVQQ